MKILLWSLFAAATLTAEVPKEHAAGQRPAAVEERIKDKGPRPPKLTAEQQQQRQALVQKYDANKDGRLDAEERKAVSEADRKVLRSFGPPGRPPGKFGPPGRPPGAPDAVPSHKNKEA
jgi:hypothetical protein